MIINRKWQKIVVHVFGEDLNEPSEFVTRHTIVRVPHKTTKGELVVCFAGEYLRVRKVGPIYAGLMGDFVGTKPSKYPKHLTMGSRNVNLEAYTIKVS